MGRHRKPKKSPFKRAIDAIGRIDLIQRIIAVVRELWRWLNGR